MKGKVKDKPFLVCQRFGTTLHAIIEKHNGPFSHQTAHQIGIQLCDLIKELHSVGYVYNDLKADNICIGEYMTDEQIERLPLREQLKHTLVLKLIDFGVSTKYSRIDPITNNQIHIAHRITSNFYGNFAFASPHAHKKHVLSRRDDFYCLVFFLSYLLTNQLLFFASGISESDNSVDTAVAKKIEQKPRDFLTDPRNKCLIPFAEYVYSLNFDEEPNYNKIRFMLTKNILDFNLVPNFKYDWNYKLYL